MNFIFHSLTVLTLGSTIVGGGYIFVHRLLMEHFASLTEEDIKRLAGSSDGR